LQRVLVRGHEVQVVAETGGPTDVCRATVQRHDDGEIEGHLAFVVRHEPSTSPVLNSVTSSMPRSASIPPSCADATGFVKAPSSGVTYVSCTASRMPRSWKYQSARKQNSSGATGHLIGMSTTLTTIRPP